VCYKETNTLKQYTYDIYKKLQLVKDYRVFTGQKNGDKIAVGDKKTPLGIYRIVQVKKDVDPFYGPLAMVTSYPNLYDRLRGKSGNGIWIHGVPDSLQRDPYTRGCIAMGNRDLVELNQNLTPSETLIVIDDTPKRPVEKSEYATILAAIYQWRDAWEMSDLPRYISFYSDDFKRFDGMNKESFALYKQRIFNKNESKTITFNNINILPYPGERDNLFWITFDELYLSDSHRFAGKKSLLIAFNSNKTISIITEE
jgi:murein L,D-transpeptidase YafK